VQEGERPLNEQRGESFEGQGAWTWGRGGMPLSSRRSEASALAAHGEKTSSAAGGPLQLLLQKPVGAAKGHVHSLFREEGTAPTLRGEGKSSPLKQPQSAAPLGSPPPGRPGSSRVGQHPGPRGGFKRAPLRRGGRQQAS